MKTSDSKAMYYLGMLFESGLRVDMNTDIALLWYKKSYSNGYTFALNKLYAFYSNPNNKFFSTKIADFYLNLL